MVQGGYPLADWQEHAECSDNSGPNYYPFFEMEGETLTKKHAREALAKEICRECPVQKECLSYAIAKPEKYGVWGGQTPEERNITARRQAIKKGD